MKPIKNVLVCLDLSDLDRTLFAHVENIVRTSGSEKVVFMNIIKNLNIPEDVLKEFPGLTGKLENDRMEHMQNSVKEHFVPGVDVQTEFVIKKGTVAKRVLKTANEHEADLIVMGRRKNSNNGGLLATRLARRANCSLLIIPEGAQAKVQRLLVPVDFSEHSTLALEEAVTLASRIPEIEVYCQNVYNVPTGYHYTGKSFEEFAQVMEKHAQKDLAKFIKTIDLKGVELKTIYTLDQDHDPVEDIYREAKKLGVDFLIIGAKGRSSTTAFFIGTIAERLVQISEEVPLAVMRPRGKNAGIIDALKEI